MSQTVFASFLLTGVVLSGVACAEQLAAPKGVVELFTSQGCASCPPADAAFEKLVKQGDVVALSYHVDYWNYLGWSDTMGSKENTERQYGYARTLGRSNVYTPQAIINGRDHISGADLAGINGRVETLKEAGEGMTVGVAADMKGDELRINIGPGKGKANVVIAYFDRQQTIDVEKGENTGKKITYWNNVSDVQTIGVWDGQQMVIALPANVIGNGKKDGCAVMLQSAGPAGEPAAILGAAVVLAGRGH